MPRRSTKAGVTGGVALSAFVHIAAVLGYWVFRPVPLPEIHVRFRGPGEARVLSSPAGIACPGQCRAAFEPGTSIRLLAVVGKGSTFSGWSADNAVCLHEDGPLHCHIASLNSSVSVRIELGKVPDAVDVAWVQESKQDPTPIQILLPRLAKAPRRKPPRRKIPQQVRRTKPVQSKLARNMTSVELADKNEVKEAPKDARFLSDKNRDVAAETQARLRNLARQHEGKNQSSAYSDIKSAEVGAEKTTVDDVTNAERPKQLSASRQKNQLFRGEGGQNGSQRREGLLSMRGIRPPNQNNALPKQGPETNRSGKRGKRGLRLSPRINLKQYERIVGADVVRAEIKAGERRISQRRGRWRKNLDAIGATYENFTPEIHPGNQTALKTRAAPFAVYIAQMHRRIHKLWGFGYLLSLNKKSPSHPLNDWSLQTIVEIVIQEDGTVGKTTIARPSGQLTFDTAAVHSVLTAAPFRAPPLAIRSPDGNTYLHWVFRRDWQQCGTFNVRPYIRGSK